MKKTRKEGGICSDPEPRQRSRSRLKSNRPFFPFFPPSSSSSRIGAGFAHLASLSEARLIYTHPPTELHMSCFCSRSDGLARKCFPCKSAVVRLGWGGVHA